MSPSRSVRRMTSAPTFCRICNAVGDGWPKSLFTPTPIIATVGSTAATNSGSSFAEPWCGSFSTSASSRAPERSNARWASSSMSPDSSMRLPPTSTISTTDSSFGPRPVGSMFMSGPSTVSVNCPATNTVPTGYSSTGTPALVASSSTDPRQRGLPAWPDLYRPDSAARQHTVQPADVVGVQVGEHQQRHAAHAESIETPGHHARLGPRIHHHRLSRARRWRSRNRLPDRRRSRPAASRRVANRERAHAPAPAPPPLRRVTATASRRARRNRSSNGAATHARPATDAGAGRRPRNHR